MNKVPVLATARAAYHFAFENYFRLLGITWVAMALFSLLWLVMMREMAGMHEAIQSHDPSAIWTSLGWFFGLEVGVLILLIVMTVGITRLALSERMKWPFFYLAFNRDFWRLFGAYILVGLILITAVAILSILSGMILGPIAASHGGAETDPGAAAQSIHNFTLALVLLIYAVMGFIFIRLALLLPPITVTEKRIGLGRNWDLTRGNFWRILAALLLILIPLVLFAILQTVLLAEFGGPSLNVFANWGTPAAQWALSQRLMKFYTTHWYIYIPAWFLVAPIFYGPLLGSSALMYRALVPQPAPTS